MNRERCYDVPAWHEKLWKEHDDSSSSAKVQVGDDKVAGFSDGYLPELYHRFYADLPNEIPADKRGAAAAVRARLHDLASELPEFSTLRKQTVRDPLWAGVATTVIGDAVADAVPEDMERDAPDADAANRILDGLRDLEEQGAATPEQIGQAAGDVFRAAEDAQCQAEGLDPSALRSALRRGIQEAQQAIDDAQSAASVLGYGSGTGSGVQVTPKVALELARKVRSSPKLKKILELAGRIQATARAKRATRSEYARSEIVGVEQTGDIARLLPSELGAFGHAVRTVDLLRRVTEKNALGYKLHGKEKATKGPIIILIDHSGSMTEANKEEWSKAVALALLDAARSEKRAFGIVLYNGSVIREEFGNPQDLDPSDILDVLSTPASGGTDFVPPMASAAAMLRDNVKLARADVVHISDGFAGNSQAAGSRELVASRGAHIFGIAIRSPKEGLAPWCHEVERIDDVSRDTVAVDLIFDNV